MSECQLINQRSVSGLHAPSTWDLLDLSPSAVEGRRENLIITLLKGDYLQPTSTDRLGKR
jgi:hypothetical protein